MREDYAPLQEHFREVAQTQLVAHAPEHHETHDLGRILQVIEARPCALIELSLTPLAPKPPVPQVGSFASFPRRSRLTVRTPHLPHLREANVYRLLLSDTSWGEF